MVLYLCYSAEVKKKKHQTNRIQTQCSATALQSDSATSDSETCARDRCGFHGANFQSMESRCEHALAQLTHAIGLNDVCNALRLHSGPLSALRGATAPSRNNLSHANKRRDAALAERLFWTVLEHLQKLSPGFAAGRRGKGLARRFRRVIHVVDSSTIALIASCIDWAQHRRRKAAAKLHVR